MPFDCCAEVLPSLGELFLVDLTDFGAGVSKVPLRLTVVEMCGVFGVTSSNLKA